MRHNVGLQRESCKNARKKSYDKPYVLLDLPNR